MTRGYILMHSKTHATSSRCVLPCPMAGNLNLHVGCEEDKRQAQPVLLYLWQAPWHLLPVRPMLSVFDTAFRSIANPRDLGLMNRS
jgi:hypothetical protein